MKINKSINSLSQYTLLGRTGLRVSPLCLGAMTFGTDWGWGADSSESKKIFDCYLAAGGNFIDTANGYTNGHSEEMLGEFIGKAGNRDRIVLATKYTISKFPGDPNAGGNSRKNIYQSIDASLSRLNTDYIDLYWMHMWDGLTPVEEVIGTFDDLISAGKIRYYGFSDVPAWYFSRALTLAESHGKNKPAALQLEYSLVSRSIEQEHIPAALDLGVGITPWGPLASGFLTGKYSKGKGDEGQGKGRLNNETTFNRFTKQNWKILDTLQKIAKKLDRTTSQVALNWITKRPGITSTIIGASKLSQLQDNLQALEFDIPADLSSKLEEVSRPEPVFPYNFFSPQLRERFLGANVLREPPWYRG